MEKESAAHDGVKKIRKMQKRAVADLMMENNTRSAARSNLLSKPFCVLARLGVKGCEYPDSVNQECCKHYEKEIRGIF